MPNTDPVKNIYICMQKIPKHYGLVITAYYWSF